MTQTTNNALAEIPSFLKNFPNWVEWNLIEKDGTSTKEPLIVGTTRNASSIDSCTWSTFDRVKQIHLTRSHGIGFVIGGEAEKANLVGFDLDGCRNPKTGEITLWADELIECVDSYVEITPSKMGLRIWVTGKLPGQERVFNLNPDAGFGNKVKIEAFDRARYFTVTGDALFEGQVPIETRDLTKAYELCRRIKAKYPPKVRTRSSNDNASSEAVQIKRRNNHSVTTKKQLLMTGKIVSQSPFVVEDEHANSVEYPSQSEADLALCSLLALEHKEPSRIDELFRTSTLCRPKWEDREDYRNNTIERALKSASQSSTSLVAPSIVIASDSTDEVVAKEEELPAFPRLTGSLAELCDALCPDIPYEFKIMAAVTHWGLIRSGLDILEDEPHLQPRFYTCLIKEPSYGKTAAINEVRTIMQMLSKRYSAMSSVDSGPALVDEFGDCASKEVLVSLDGRPAARVLLDPDEMTDLFEKSKVTSQGRNSLFTEMLKLYESNRTGNRSRKAGKSQMENAHLAILAGATPTGYERMWTGTGGGSGGLQSRFILISTNGKKMPIRKTPTNNEALAACLTRLHKQSNLPGSKIQIEPEAADMLSEWWNASTRDKPSESRADDMAKRLLIVLAATNDTSTISKELMTQAIRFGDYIISAREKFNPLDSYSWTQAFETEIRKVGTRHPSAKTLNEFRHLVHPDRRPGGLGPFLQAWKNMIAAGELKADSTTQKGTVKYRL